MSAADELQRAMEGATEVLKRAFESIQAAPPDPALLRQAFDEALQTPEAMDAFIGQYGADEYNRLLARRLGRNQ